MKYIEELISYKKNIDAIQISEILWLSQFMDNNSSESIETSTPPLDISEPLGENIEDEVNKKKEEDYNIPTNTQQERGDYGFDKNSDTASIFSTNITKEEKFPDIDKQFSSLKVRQKTISNDVLDDSETADYIATTGYFHPIFKEVKTKRSYFNLHIIIDQSESIFLWKKSAEHFIKSVKFSTNFKSIKVFNLESNQENITLSYANSNYNINANSALFRDKQSITLVFSDIIGKAWKTNDMFKVLEQWSKGSFVTIVSMLPKRMWKKTPLRQGISIFTTSTKPLPKNKDLKAEFNLMSKESNEKIINIPLLTFDSNAFSYLSDILMSKKDSWIDTRIFKDLKFQKIKDNKPVNISPNKRVEKFFSFALPKVRQLAVYCSVLPLNQEIIREVIRVKELGNEKDVFSEFYFGGLIDKGSKADIGEYKFYDGVAKELRQYISMQEAEILFRILSDIISSSLGVKYDLNLLYEANIDEPLSDSEKLLANMMIEILKDKGSFYGEKVERLISKVKIIDEVQPHNSLDSVKNNEVNNTFQCDEIINYTVAIEYQGMNGSGFIVKLDNFLNNFFVFTAKHIFMDEFISIDIDLNEVSINYQKTTIKPISFIFLESDLIVFIFENSVLNVIDNLKKIPLDSHPNQFKESIFAGYTRDNLVCQKCIYSQKAKGKNLYEIKSDYKYNIQNIRGISGSGLFIKKDNKYFLVGMILQYDENMLAFNYLALSPIIDEIISQVDESLNKIKQQNLTFDDDRDTPENRQMSLDIESKIIKLMKLSCFDIDTVEVDVFNGIAHIFIDGEDAPLLIGKEGYRYNALSYMLFNWINAHYNLYIKLEISEFIQAQEEMIDNYLKPIAEFIQVHGSGKTKPLDGILIQIALEKLCVMFPDKYIAIKTATDGRKFIIIDNYSINNVKFDFFKAGVGNSILVSTENTNILIDGGLKKTYEEEIKPKLYSLSKSNSALNLVISTHRDNDHIGGLIKLFEDKNNKSIIKDVWCNFDNSIDNTLIESSSMNISDSDMKRLFYFLREENILYRDDIFLSKNNLQKEYQINDIKLQLLSPIKAEKNIFMRGKKDASIANSSSIAFILKYQNKQFLFLSDAHIEVINYTLKGLGFSKENRLQVEFIKLSHGGSIKNINTEFLDMIDTNRFVILTNGKRFDLPHEETLELILTHELRNNSLVEFICNYENVLEKKVSKENLDKYNCKLVYATSLNF